MNSPALSSFCSELIDELEVADIHISGTWVFQGKLDRQDINLLLFCVQSWQ